MCAERVGAELRRADRSGRLSCQVQVPKSLDLARRAAASAPAACWPAMRSPSPMPSPIQKVLCRSIDGDVPAERVQTLLERFRLVEDLDDLELPAVVQCALAQEGLPLVRRF